MNTPTEADAWYSSSASTEWYTPRYIIDAVLAVLGTIDCDPCSNPEPFNVPATVHYTKADDGLGRPWTGRVYANPPFGGGNLKYWVAKLEAERALGHCTEAIMLTPGRFEAGWFQPFWDADAICFPRKRIEFIGGSRSGNVINSVLVYWGPHATRFHEVFSGLGKVIYPNAPYRRQAHQLTLLEATA